MQSVSAVGSAPSGPAALLERTLFEVKRVIVGQDRLIERTLVCLLARGHCLLEGVPGLAKTLTVETFANTVGGSFVRIQFTPDLVPSDIVGTRIYRPTQERFDVELGPVFANFVLADEINRAPAKVQSALLEVMAERQVSIGGTTHPVPEPFLVLATQNPIESEGVYPLPEAQRDRFLMKVAVDYPSAADELEIVRRMSVEPPRATQVLEGGALLTLQRTADAVFVHHAVADYAVHLVLASRAPAQYGLPDLEPLIAYGGSPRASLGLVAAGRALALLRGRDYLLPQDVFDVAPEVLRHRVVPSFDALADGISPDQLVNRILSTVVAPRIAPSQERPVELGEGKHRVTDAPPAAPQPMADVAARAEAVLRSLELTVTRRLDGLLQGDFQGLVPGSGTERGEGREYRPGDDVRRIDWNLTARTAVPHVSDTIVDRELETWIVADCSASLDFGTADCEKRDLVLAAVAAVGFLTARTGNRLGAVIDRPPLPLVHPARGDRASFLALLRRLATMPRADSVTPDPASPPLVRALTTVERVAERRGLIVVTSDFLGDPATWERPLRRLSARHDVLAVEVADPRELSLPAVGVLTLVDPETGARIEVQTSNKKLRARYDAAAAQQRAAIALALRHAGAEQVQLRTDRDWVLDLVRFVRARRRRRAGRAVPARVSGAP